MVVAAVDGQAGFAGVKPGMVLSSVGGAPVSMLSYEGAMDQIEICKTAGGSVFSVGFQLGEPRRSGRPSGGTAAPRYLEEEAAEEEEEAPEVGDRYYVSFEDGTIVRSGERTRTLL